MHTIHRDLAVLGGDLNDEDFCTMLLGLFSQRYNFHLLAITATLSVLVRTYLEKSR